MAMYEVVYRERENWDGQTYHLRQCPDLQSSVNSAFYFEQWLRAHGYEVAAVRDSDVDGIEELPRR